MIEILRWVAFAAYLSIPLVYFKGGVSIFKDIRESIQSTKSILSTVLVLSLLVVGIALLGALCSICLGHGTTFAWADNEWVVVLGTVLTLASVATAYWCHFGTLQRFWSGSVKMPSENQIVDDGLYGVVRHPLYTAAVVMHLGLAITFAGWTTWFVCGLMIVGYWSLTAYEDSFLAKALPGYREFQGRTHYRLIPGVW